MGVRRAARNDGRINSMLDVRDPFREQTETGTPSNIRKEKFMK